MRKIQKFQTYVYITNPVKKCLDNNCKVFCFPTNRKDDSKKEKGTKNKTITTRKEPLATAAKTFNDDSIAKTPKNDTIVKKLEDNADAEKNSNQHYSMCKQ